MNCPNCGKEISENQKFCTNCGTRIDNILNEKDNDKNIETQETNTTDNQEKEMIDGKINKGLYTPANKIIAIISCLVLILLFVFGIIQYKQYLKDIEPYETKMSFYDNSIIECTLTFDKIGKNAVLSMLFNDVVIQQWQIDYLNENSGTYEFTDKENKYTFKFENIKLNLGEPLVLNFKINEVKNSKDFVQLKQNFDNISLTRSIPNVLKENPKTRLSEKQKWLELKEQERKQKEWRENVLSNCVYKTSDGVCYTTTAFYPTPLNYYDCTGGLTTYEVEESPTRELSNIGINICYHHEDYWAGAMKQCNDWGYKLPDSYELASLAKDILGVSINNQKNITTYSPDGHKINMEPIEKLKVKKWSEAQNAYQLNFWESTDIDKNDAYVRRFYAQYYGYASTQRMSSDKYIYPNGTNAVCVYNPNGKAKISYEKQKQKEEELKKQEEEKSNKEAQNALF